MGAAIMWPFTAGAADANTGSAYDYSFTTLVGSKPLRWRNTRARCC
jgi:hypothetical protein